VLAFVATMLVGVVVNAPMASATTINVNTATDPAPNAQGQWPTNGVCSLRAAIRSAQNNSNAADVDCATGLGGGVLDIIQIAPNLAGQTMTLSWSIAGKGVQPFDTITGVGNPLQIIGPTTNATQFAISGGNAVRPFNVGTLGEQGDLRLANLTVRNGNGRNNGSNVGVDRDGGAFYLSAQTKLTLDNVIVRDNTVSGTGRGGAIAGVRPIITNNGGAYVNNRALGDGSTNPSGGRGGAIYVTEGPWTLNGYAVLFQGNQASYAGAVVFTTPGNANPLVHLERSLLRDNTASVGAVMFSESTGVGTILELHDSTLVNNSSVLFTLANAQGFSFLRDTFVNTGRLFHTGAGFMANSIATGNSECFDAGGPGNITGSRNLLGGTNCPNFAGLGNIGTVTNLAAALAQNGGPEVQQTFAIAPGSNAIDNGDSAYCGTIDARSIPRGVDGNGAVNSPQPKDCDIGAYEFARFIVNFVTGTSAANEAPVPPRSACGCGSWIRRCRRSPQPSASRSASIRPRRPSAVPVAPAVPTTTTPTRSR
jgi:hypothetical protein